LATVLRSTLSTRAIAASVSSSWNKVNTFSSNASSKPAA
jgi:hypothetical protein